MTFRTCSIRIARVTSSDAVRRPCCQHCRTKPLPIFPWSLAAGAFLAPAAQATPIQFYNVVSNGQGQGNARFEIGCGGANGSCANLLEALTGTGPLTWSSSAGEMLAGPSDASPSSEASYVSGLLGVDVAAGSAGNVTPSGNNSPFEFMTSADYFMVKVGAGPTSQAYALLHN
ncbi:MAG TPA: hypothetical protein VF292_01340, partial [Rhodanobacteraceae bacterium]